MWSFVTWCGTRRHVAVFISYSRRDEDAVQSLKRHLELVDLAPWIDTAVPGGEEWWGAILQRIRDCKFFVFAASEHSLASRWCEAELRYAVALDRAILPVTVREFDPRLALDRIGLTGRVDYSRRTEESVIQLTREAVLRTSGPLPSPLPPEPPMPTTSLTPLRELVAQPSLGSIEQNEVFDELRDLLGDADLHDSVLTLLRRLRDRSDVTVAVARAVGELLASTPGVGFDPASADLLRSVITHKDNCTLITGFGLTDSMLGPRSRIAEQWSERHNFAMAKQHRGDLPRVAQFVSVMTDAATMRSELRKYRGERPHGGSDLDAWLQATWREHRAASRTDPHMVLASMPCRIFVNAHPAGLLEAALREAGKTPEVKLCKWRSEFEWPLSLFTLDAEYEPSAERPLVFKVFGSLDRPESLVLTEDDYLDFLVQIARNKSLIPSCVRSALTDSALLFLGFELEDWDMKVLLRSLVSQQGARKLRHHSHLAAQVDLSSTVLTPDRAQRYLEKYFSNREPNIGVFWGTVDEFTEQLATHMEDSK